MQKNNTPTTSNTPQVSEKSSAVPCSSNGTGQSSFAEQRSAAHHVEHSPEPHAFRPVLLTGFSSAESGNTGNSEFPTEDSAYSTNLSNSFRTWEQARRSQSVSSSYFPFSIFFSSLFLNIVENDK